MLILTRRLGEVINIGEDIKVKIVAIHGKRIRIGIEAPISMNVHRQEIYNKIIKENKSAANKGEFKNIENIRNKLKDKQIINIGSEKRTLTLNKTSHKERL